MKKAIPSFNDLKKAEQEALEKSGTFTKLAIAAALAGPVLNAQKGTMFNPPSDTPSRSVAGVHMEEKHDEDNGKHETVDSSSGAAITHSYSTPKTPTVKYEVDGKAQSVKEKLAHIRNQIKGME